MTWPLEGGDVHALCFLSLLDFVLRPIDGEDRDRQTLPRTEPVSGWGRMVVAAGSSLPYLESLLPDGRSKAKPWIKR